MSLAAPLRSRPPSQSELRAIWGIAASDLKTIGKLADAGSGASSLDTARLAAAAINAGRLPEINHA
jgi:hypothetical protein